MVPIADRPRALHSRCSARKARPFTSAYVIAAEAAASTADGDGGEVTVAASAVAETLIEEPTHDRGDGDDDDDDDDARCWKPVVGVIMDPLVTTATVRTHAFAELDRRIVFYFSYYRAFGKLKIFGWAGSLLSMEEDFGLGCDHELRRMNPRISDRFFLLSTCSCHSEWTMDIR